MTHTNAEFARAVFRADSVESGLTRFQSSCST